MALPRYPTLALCLVFFVLQMAQAQEPATDSLHIRIYHEEEIASLADVPEVFPRHRPGKLLLRGEGRAPAAATMLQIADTLAALQKLTGLPYYSQSEKKTKTLFKVSEVIAHPRAPRPVADPVFHALPLDTCIYVRQVDNRLGTVVYRVELHADGRCVTFRAANVAPIEKFGVHLAEIDDCILYIAIQKQGDYLEFTAWQWLRFKSGLLGVFVKEESFVHRLRAVAGFYLAALRAAK